MTSSILLRVNNLHKNFNHREVLNDLSFELSAGERWVVQGASGSGKSTLLHLITGLDTPDSGNITFLGKELTKLNPSQLALMRNYSIGIVFQFHFLLPGLSALENILLPVRIGKKISSKEGIKRATAYAEELGVAHLLQQYPHQLSGGEQQRINIIRAIIHHPSLLLCDEPTGNLDEENSQKVTELLNNLAKQLNSALIFITHDNQLANKFEQRFCLRHGRLERVNQF